MTTPEGSEQPVLTSDEIDSVIDRLALYVDFFESTSLTTELIEYVKDLGFPESIARLLFKNITPVLLGRAKKAGKSIISNVVDSTLKSILSRSPRLKLLFTSLEETINAKINNDNKKQQELKQRLLNVVNALQDPAKATEIYNDINLYSALSGSDQANPLI